MSIRRLNINLESGDSYEVRVGSGAMRRLGETLRSMNESKHAVIIYDAALASKSVDVRKVLEESDYRVSDLEVPSGEKSKSIAVASELWSALAMLKVERDDLVVALGGGVIGDLAGFVAATYMRGISFVSVPTTLLAMVDASVGGKNAIDLPEGKNLVGTFAQPLAVCADTDFLATLPPREWACGFGEVAKSVMLGSSTFYDWLSMNIDALVAHDEAAVEDCIAQCIAFKASVVARDEHETQGVRECLNYGHTLGHAIEALTGYGTVSHGEAVAEGMRFAARLAVDVLGTDVSLVTEQDALLDILGLTSLDVHLAPEDVYASMVTDKKSRGGVVRFVLPRAQGDWEVVKVPREKLMTHLSAWARSKG